MPKVLFWGWQQDNFGKNRSPILNQCPGMTPLSAYLVLTSFFLILKLYYHALVHHLESFGEQGGD